LIWVTLSLSALTVSLAMLVVSAMLTVGSPRRWTMGVLALAAASGVLVLAAGILIML